MCALKVHVTPQLASTFITESAVQKSHLISLLITVYPLPWFFIGKDAWSDSCVTARIPRSHSICNSSPFKNGNFLLKMELESEAFFLGIFHR